MMLVIDSILNAGLSVVLIILIINVRQTSKGWNESFNDLKKRVSCANKKIHNLEIDLKWMEDLYRLQGKGGQNDVNHR